MSGLSRQRHDQAIGKAQRWTFAEKIQSIGHGVRVLQRQVFVVEQHSNSLDYLIWWLSVHRSKHPRRLGERESGNPRAFPDERLGRGCLSRVVTRKNARQNIGINRAHRSRARMALCDVLPDTVFQFGKSSRFRRSVREQLPMDVLGRELTGPPNDDRAIILTPFQNGPRPDP